LNDSLFAILINKQDCEDRMSTKEIEEKVALISIEQTHKFFEVSGKTGKGMDELLDWLGKNLSKKQRKIEEKKEINKNEEEDLFVRWIEVEDEPDDEFIEKFKTYKLEKWDHRTHLRIAWLYLTKDGRREGMKKIFEGIKNFIENSNRTNGKTFHETMTYFWIHMVHYAIQATPNPSGDFKGFLLMNPQLSNGGMFLQYYKKETMLNNPEARVKVILPDLKPLPSIIDVV